MSAFSLEGKVALISGAGRGIGAAIATAFAQAGAQVVIANRSPAPATELAASLMAQGRDARAIEFTASEEGCRKAVAEAARLFGALDIVVHNAGGCRWTALADMTADILDEALTLNLKCCFWLAQAAVPELVRRGGGRILITSSVTGPRVAMAEATHYAAAKAGVNGFIRAAALELAPNHITVNGVEPGFIAKDRGRLSQAETRSRIEHYIPLGAMGKATDIAHAMLYLASPAAGFITGQTIVVDGGSTLPDSGYAMDDLNSKSGAHPS
jgi:3-oxoacyl-[acyl-carrier protein] reductase